MKAVLTAYSNRITPRQVEYLWRCHIALYVLLAAVLFGCYFAQGQVSWGCVLALGVASALEVGGAGLTLLWAVYHTAWS